MRNFFRLFRITIRLYGSIYTLRSKTWRCFFLQLGLLSKSSIEILLPIRDTPNGYTFTGFRGLASHGAVIGSLIGLYLYRLKFKERSLLWLLDRVTIPVSIGASFVRIGNFLIQKL